MRGKLISVFLVIAFIIPVAHAGLEIIGKPPVLEASEPKNQPAARPAEVSTLPASAPAASSSGSDVKRLETELSKLRTDYERVNQELVRVKKDVERLSETGKTPQEKAQQSANIQSQPPQNAPPQNAPPQTSTKSEELGPLKERMRYTVQFNAYQNEFHPSEKTARDVLEYAKRADRVIVIGYTAGKPSPTNNRVAIGRAIEVRRFLLDRGIPSSKISIGGGTDHIADDSTKEGRIKNRRVEIDFLPMI